MRTRTSGGVAGVAGHYPAPLCRSRDATWPARLAFGDRRFAPRSAPGPPRDATWAARFAFGDLPVAWRQQARKNVIPELLFLFLFLFAFSSDLAGRKTHAARIHAESTRS